MTDRFDTYIARILSHEGGYTNDRRDAGNWTGGKVGVGELKGTKYGIAANTYPTVDIKNLTWEQAKAIYRRDFWEASRADKMHPAFSFQMLDAAVNHGIGNASRMLQRAAGVAPDGIIGPITLKAVNATDPADLVLRFMAERIEFYTGLGNFTTFGKGWMRRMAGNMRHASNDN